MPTAKSWLRGSFKEWFLVIAVFLLTLGFMSLYTYPIYYEFDAPGDMVPVREFGIDGTVHFVTVYNGVTEDLLDLYLNEWSNDPDATFTRIEPYYAKDVTDLEEQATYREETITHAFEAVMEEADSGYYEDRLDEVLSLSEGYYGSSLGLMVGIGLEEEKRGADFSLGGLYRIAGTGTLEADFTVGSIGALEQKLIVANRERVTHFFIPKDYEWYGEESNEAEAQRVVQERGFTMTIIPVATLQEALDYIDRLQFEAGGGLQ